MKKIIKKLSVMIIATVAIFGLVSSSEAGGGYPPAGAVITLGGMYHCVTADGLVIPYKYLIAMPNLMGNGYMFKEYYAPNGEVFSCKFGCCVQESDYCECRDIGANLGPYPIK